MNYQEYRCDGCHFNRDSFCEDKNISIYDYLPEVCALNSYFLAKRDQYRGHDITYDYPYPNRYSVYFKGRYHRFRTREKAKAYVDKIIKKRGD